MKKILFVLVLAAAVATFARCGLFGQKRDAGTAAATQNFLITDFLPDDGTIPSNNIQTVENTCLITVPMKARHFEDENSEEAEAYFTAADDHMYYTWELATMFEKMGVSRVSAQRRYLSFAIDGGRTIVVDTEKAQRGQTVNAVLYKRGRIPLFLYLIPGDNNWEEINEYFNKVEKYEDHRNQRQPEG